MQVTILNYRFSVFQFQFSIVNYQLNKFMAFRKDNKIKSNFSKISIGLASPEAVSYTHLSLKEAAQLVKEITYTKFDASLDIDVRLGVDPRKACLLYTSHSS